MVNKQIASFISIMKEMQDTPSGVNDVYDFTKNFPSYTAEMQWRRDLTTDSIIQAQRRNIFLHDVFLIWLIKIGLYLLLIWDLTL